MRRRDTLRLHLSLNDGGEMIRSPAKASRSELSLRSNRASGYVSRSIFYRGRDLATMTSVFLFGVTIDRDFDAFSLSRASLEDAPKTPFGATIGDSARRNRRVQAITYGFDV